MKKKLSFVLCVVLTGLTIVGLCGCGGSTEEGSDAVKGTYNIKSAAMMGVEVSAEEIGMDGMSMDFNGAGKVTFTVDGSSGTTDYTLNGTTVTFELEGEAFTATLDGTTLTFTDFMGFGIDLTMERQ